jgi:hypothetical protein
MPPDDARLQDGMLGPLSDQAAPLPEYAWKFRYPGDLPNLTLPRRKPHSRQHGIGLVLPPIHSWLTQSGRQQVPPDQRHRKCEDRSTAQCYEAARPVTRTADQCAYEPHNESGQHRCQDQAQPRNAQLRDDEPLRNQTCRKEPGTCTDERRHDRQENWTGLLQPCGNPTQGLNENLCDQSQQRSEQSFHDRFDHRIEEGQEQLFHVLYTMIRPRSFTHVSNRV